MTAIKRDPRAQRIERLTARAAALEAAATAATRRLGAIAKRLRFIANFSSRGRGDLSQWHERPEDNVKTVHPLLELASARQRQRLGGALSGGGFSNLLSHLLAMAGHGYSRPIAGKHPSHSFAGSNSDDRKVQSFLPRTDRLASASLTVPRSRDFWGAIATALRVATGSRVRHAATPGRIIAIQAGPGKTGRRKHSSATRVPNHAKRSLILASPDKSARVVALFGLARREHMASWDDRRASRVGYDRKRDRRWSQFLGSLTANSRLSSVAGSIAARNDNRASDRGSNHSRLAFETIRRSIARISHGLLRDLAKQINPGANRLILPIATSASPPTAPPPQAAKEPTPAATGAQGIVVNYSPTLVVQGTSEIQEIERRLLDAIGRHGHELANIIDREYAKRTRTEL